MSTIDDLTETQAAAMPRPAYVTVSLWSPARTRGQRRPDEKWVYAAEVSDYDPEWQVPLTFVQEMLDSACTAATRLRDLADEPGVDWYVEVASDGFSLYSGPGWQAVDELEHQIAVEARTIVNP